MLAELTYNGENDNKNNENIEEGDNNQNNENVEGAGTIYRNIKLYGKPLEGLRK